MRDIWDVISCDEVRVAAREEQRMRLAAELALAEVERCINEGIGSWLSAALEDENVCDEMKFDIRAFFELFNIFAEMPSGDTK